MSWLTLPSLTPRFTRRSNGAPRRSWRSTAGGIWAAGAPPKLFTRRVETGAPGAAGIRQPGASQNLGSVTGIQCGQTNSRPLRQGQYGDIVGYRVAQIL